MRTGLQRGYSFGRRVLEQRTDQVDSLWRSPRPEHLQVQRAHGKRCVIPIGRMLVTLLWVEGESVSIATTVDSLWKNPAWLLPLGHLSFTTTSNSDGRGTFHSCFLLENCPMEFSFRVSLHRISESFSLEVNEIIIIYQLFIFEFSFFPNWVFDKEIGALQC